MATELHRCAQLGIQHDTNCAFFMNVVIFALTSVATKGLQNKVWFCACQIYPKIPTTLPLTSLFMSILCQKVFTNMQRFFKHKFDPTPPLLSNVKRYCTIGVVLHPFIELPIRNFQLEKKMSQGTILPANMPFFVRYQAFRPRLIRFPDSV